MRIRQTLEIVAGHKHGSVNRPEEPMTIKHTLLIEGATRGDGVAGAIKECHDGVRRQITDALDRRPY